MNIPLSSIVINAKENENQLLTINYFLHMAQINLKVSKQKIIMLDQERYVTRPNSLFHHRHRRDLRLCCFRQHPASSHT